MAGRSLAVLVLVALTLGFLLLFSPQDNASAVTFKIGYGSYLSCLGADAADADDNSCTPGTEYNFSPVTADLTTNFKVKSADDGTPHKHSNFAKVNTFNTPPEWSMVRGNLLGGCGNAVDDDNDGRINDGCPAVGAREVQATQCANATDDDVPKDGWINDGCDQLGAVGEPSTSEGAYAGVLVTVATLSLYNGPCSTGIPITLPLYDSTTDINNTVPWVGDGDNLLLDPDGNGLPEYVDKFPSFLLNIAEPDEGVGLANSSGLRPPVKPAARYAGHVHATSGAPATKLEFLVYEPAALSMFRPPNSEAALIDSYGYVNFVVMDNPTPGSPASPSSITEFCEPLSTDTTLFGKTQGKGQLYTLPGVGLEMTVPQPCKDTPTAPLCLITRATNPADNTGIWGTDTHLVGAYAQSNRDADGDGIPNAEDGCPVHGINDGCAAYTPSGGTGAETGAQCNNNLDDDADAINDGCPALGTSEAVVAAQCLNALDDDSDGKINDGCPTYTPAGGTGAEIGAQCDNADDDDADAINDGCAAYPGPGTTGQETGAQCLNMLDDDGDGVVDGDGDGVEDVCDPVPGTLNNNIDGDTFQNRQDNCPLLINYDQADTDALAPDGGPGDSIGDKCDPHPINAVTEGAYLQDMAREGICLGGMPGSAVDTDSDGWCGETEDKAGPGGAISDKAVTLSTPEYTALDPMPGVPGTCSNRAWYATAGDPAGQGAPVNDDLDANTNAADTNCVALTGDADQDGVGDGTDNCLNNYNPEQLDTDADGTAGGAGGTYVGGDACDGDDDGDKKLDYLEFLYGGEAKNGTRWDLAFFGMDLNGDTQINSTDANAYRGLSGLPAVQPGTVP